MQASGKDSPNTRRTLSVQGHDYQHFSLPAASDILGDISRLPMSLKVLLENILRHEDGRADEVDDAWEPQYPAPPSSAERSRTDFAASVLRLLDVSGSDTDVVRLLTDADGGLAQYSANVSMRNDAPDLGPDERALAAMVLQRGIRALELVRTLIAGESRDNRAVRP
jgi:hypothetical protein